MTFYTDSVEPERTFGMQCQPKSEMTGQESTTENTQDSSHNEGRSAPRSYSPEEYEALKADLKKDISDEGLKIEVNDSDDVVITTGSRNEDEELLDPTVIEAIRELAHDPAVWGLFLLFLINQLIWVSLTIL